MYIDGQWVKTKGTFEVLNPATGEKIADVPDGGQEDAATAIAAADRAFPAWSNLTAYQRSAYLYRAYQIMMENDDHYG